MNVYLTIMVTVLVVTQVVRIIQNTIQLSMQKRRFNDTIGWLDRNEVTEEDFETQRAVYKMLYKALSGRYDEQLDFLEFLFNTIQPNQMEHYMTMYHCEGVPTCGEGGGE